MRFPMRLTNLLPFLSALALAEQSDPTCLGLVFGVIGRVEFTSNGPSYLILIKEQKQAATHPLTGDPIYKIEKVVAVPLTTSDTNGIVNGNGTIASELQLSSCPKHRNHYGSSNGESKPGVVAGFSLLQKGQKKMAKATVDSFKFVTNKMNVRGIGGGNKVNQPEPAEKERIRTERRLVMEFLRMFNDGDSFYYCPKADLTNSVQRLSTRTDWSFDFKDSDERFVWNTYMLRDLIKQDEESIVKPSPARRWLIPIIQGFVGVENCSITLGGELERAQSPIPSGYVPAPPETFHFRLMLISRRSIYRAGTRYIKRGIDADGHCANYVETEQILLMGDDGRHAVAFIQVRGSVPVYWSQPGYKYKPPPKLDRPKAESALAFQKHFDEELKRYSSVVVVNLVEQNGKEKVLSDAYVDHVLDLDSDNVTYVGFDFHEHCRGLRFENVAILTMALEEQLAQSRFCWMDKAEQNCNQNGVFRVNCVDCLDRTNVVQAALGRMMMELQLRKFGLLPPEVTLSPSCLQAFQLLWASNGDAISRQYTGTAALKGDFTRTGQRNLAGMMKDGYNSANRYYLCHMKDARRQAAIDAFLGRRTIENDQELENMLKSKLEAGGAEDEASWLKEKDEQLRLFVRDCERLVVPDGEVILGGWAFINADPGTGDETEEDMDTCVILTRAAYYVADYDEDLDKFVDFQRVPLTDVLKIEAGPMTVASVLGVPKTKATCLRITYKIDDSKEEYFHVWRSGSTRLFNNLAIAIKSPDEADEYMKAIAEQFRVSLELIGQPATVLHPPKLERKRSKLPPSKLAFRRNASTFGPPPVFFSSLTSFGGGMKSFGSKFTAAFNNAQHGQGMKFFRLGSRRNNYRSANAASHGLRVDNDASPLIKLDQPINGSSAASKVYQGPVVNKQAGLLFGIGVASATSTLGTGIGLRRCKSDSDIRDGHQCKDVEISVNLGAQCDILVPDLYPFSPYESVGPATPTSARSNCDSSTTRGPSLLVPNQHAGHMRTSHSETSFKPLQADPAAPGSGQRALAVSQTALDKATDKGSQAPGSAVLKLPLLFKRKPEDVVGAPGDKKKFAQFQERIQKSKTRFLLL